jgi:hypothetical protein
VTGIDGCQFLSLFNEINESSKLSTGRVKAFETLRDRGGGACLKGRGGFHPPYRSAR